MKQTFYTEGKTTYWVRYNRFINDTNLRNGKQKAIDYCLQNFIDTNEIIVFDSMLECDRYEYLLELQKRGEITDLKHHLSLPLIASYTNYNGDTIPELRYNADFVYKENGKNIVEDVKGASLFQDTRFEAIKIMFDKIYINKTYIRIVIKRNGEWVEWKLGDPKKTQKLIKKQSNKIKELKKQLQEQAQKERLQKRYYELVQKPKLTKAERERLAYIRSYLNID